MSTLLVFVVSSLVFATARVPSADFLLPSYDGIQNDPCRRQGLAYRRGLDSFTPWAVQMFDSSAKMPSGVLVSDGYELGVFDECVAVRGELAQAGGRVHGQYCLVDIHYRHNISWSSTLNKFTVNGSRNHQAPQDVVRWAVCAPSSCDPNDLQIALRETVRRLQPRFNVRLEVKPHMCQTQSSIEERKHFNLTDYTVLMAGALLLFLVITSSIYDSKYRKNCTGETSTNPKKYVVALPVQFLLCFSASRNLAYLSQLNLSQTGLDCIHGLRLVFMVLVIAGHRFTADLRSPLLDVTTVEKGYHQWSYTIMLNGLLIDSFFVYSGLLTAYYLPIELNQRKQLNPLLIWLYRFIRLTPLYMAVLLFHATLLGRLGSGPLWPQAAGLQQQRCANNLWLNLLYLNNYLHSDQLCMFQSWYLAVDTHLFMVAVLVIYCLWRWPVIGHATLILFALSSVFIPFVVIFHTKSDSSLSFYYQDRFREMYISTHMRAGPYVVGVAAGYFLYQIRDQKYTVSKRWLYVGHTLCALLGLTVQYVANTFYTPGAAYNTFSTAVYGATHRVLWAAAVAANVVLLQIGKIDWLHKALTWPPLVPVSRLTYCAYLVHSLPHLFELSLLREPQTLSCYKTVWMLTGDIIFTFLISLFLCLLVEAPFRGIERIIFGIRKAPLDNNNQTIQPRRSEAS